MPRKKSKLETRGAFTLIEMVVVVTLVAILAALIIPEMKGSFDDALLRSTGRDLVDIFGLASSRAVSLNQSYRVKFDPNTGDYKMERQVHNGGTVDFVPLKDVPGAEGRIDPRISVQIMLVDDDAPGSEAGQGELSEHPGDAILFFPDGTASGARIRLSDREGFQLLLQLNPVTARVRVAAPQHE